MEERANKLEKEVNAQKMGRSQSGHGNRYSVREIQGRCAVIRGQPHGNRYIFTEIQGRHTFIEWLTHGDRLGGGFYEGDYKYTRKIMNISGIN